MNNFSFDDFFTYIRAQPGLIEGAQAKLWAKGDDVFRQGETCPDVYILAKGLVKLHYVTLEGKEWIKSFVTDKGLFGSRASQSLGQPSSFSATCIEDCEVYCLSYQGFEKLCAQDPKLAAMAFQFFQWLGLKKELREYQLLCLSAEERYRNFLNDNPNLAARITQTDMARYLGITPIALSRIKGRLNPDP